MLIPKIGGLHNHISQHISQRAPNQVNPCVKGCWTSLATVLSSCWQSSPTWSLAETTLSTSYITPLQGASQPHPHLYCKRNLSLNSQSGRYTAPQHHHRHLLSSPHSPPYGDDDDDDDEQGCSRCLPLLKASHQRLVLWKTRPHSSPGLLSVIIIIMYFSQDFYLSRLFPAKVIFVIVAAVTDHNDAIIKMMMASTPCLGVSAHSP